MRRSVGVMPVSKMLLKSERRCCLFGSVSHLKNSAGMVSGPVALPFLTFLSVLLSSGTVGVHVDLAGACDGGGWACVVSEWCGPALVLQVLCKGLCLLHGVDHLAL